MRRSVGRFSEIEVFTPSTLQLNALRGFIDEMMTSVKSIMLYLFVIIEPFLTGEERGTTKTVMTSADGDIL